MAAKIGDTVKVHYTGKFDDGEIFDTSVDREPLEFTIGSEQVIPGFENAVIDMNVGEVKDINIPSENAYGPYHEELMLKIDRSQFPPEVNPEEGQQFEMVSPDGEEIVVTVSEVTEDSVILDANHPLAGKDLNFEIQLVEIV